MHTSERTLCRSRVIAGWAEESQAPGHLGQEGHKSEASLGNSQRWEKEGRKEGRAAPHQASRDDAKTKMVALACDSLPAVLIRADFHESL